MGKIILESSSLPNYSPQKERSPGLHLSDIIHDISLCWGYYEFNPNPSPALINKWRLGLANEDAFIRQLKDEHPGRYLTLGEIEYDGVYMNLDLFEGLNHFPEEFKLSWKSSRWPGDSEKFWSFWAQIKGYCKGMGSRQGRLRIVFPRDDYKSNDVGYRQWLQTFSKAEINDNWRSMLDHSKSMCKVCKLSRYCVCGLKGKEKKPSRVITIGDIATVIEEGVR